MNAKTIFDAYTQYEEVTTRKNKSEVRSIIHRYLAVEWGGEAPKGGKAKNYETMALADFLKTVPATKLVGTMDILEQKLTGNKNHSNYECAYRAFLKWAEENGYFVDESTNKKEEPPVKPNLFNRNPNGTGSKRKSSYHGIRKNLPYSLMAYSNSNKRKLFYPGDYINEMLKEELASFVRFRQAKHGVRKVTADNDIKRLLQILGWLHREKGVSLEQLSLSSIITHQTISQFEDSNNRKQAMQAINKNVDLIKEYLDFCQVKPKSQIVIIDACIALAKFIFKNEVGLDEYGEYIGESDLPMVKRLSHFKKEINQLAKYTPPAVPYEDKSVALEEAMDVLEILRLKADCLRRQIKNKVTLKSGEIRYKIHTCKRTKASIINDLQSFLSLAFMILIPTDRARTYYELELGRTFKYGLYDGRRFTSVDRMKDKSQAQWYIHLKPEDYKTGNKYKEYWGLMPNYEFEVGKRLYDYIDEWIKEGRELEQKCKHNRFFRGAINYQELKHLDWTQRIKSIFVQHCNVPVTPKELRKMYITYLYNQKVDSSTMDSTAYAMHHSRKMQQEVYNSQTMLERLQPIYELNEKMHQDFFGKDSKPED